MLALLAANALVSCCGGAIALDRRVATVEAVVRELAQKSGEDLRIRPEMRDEVLYLSLEPRDAGTLMGLVAKAASAQWYQDEGHTWLGRPAGFWRAQGRKDREALGAAMARALAPQLDPDDIKPWDAATARTRWLTYERSPAAQDRSIDWRVRMARSRSFSAGARLLSRTLRALPAEAMANVAPGHAERFAPRPNRRQRPLADVGLRQYVAERNDFTRVLDRLNEKERNETAGSANFFSTVGAFDGEARPVLRISRDYGTNVRFMLQVEDSQGRSLDAVGTEIDVADEADAHGLPRYAEWAKTEYPANRTVTESEPPDPATVALLSDPVNHEPLDVLLSPALGALAKGMGGEVALVVPDDALVLLESGPKLGGFANGLARFVTFDVSDGLVVGYARRPTERAATKAMRAPLGRFLRTMRARIPRLADVAEYASAQNLDACATWFEAMVERGMGLPGLMDELRELGRRGGRETLRAYSRLSPIQRDALWAGGTIPVASLSPAARADLEAALFDAADGVGLEQPWEGRWTFCRRDATYLADGLGPDAVLSGSPPFVNPVAAARSASGWRVDEPDSLGRLLAQQERGEDLDPRSGYPDVAKGGFVPGTRRTLVMTTQPTATARLKAWLTDTDADPGAKPIGMGDLPGEHGKAFRAAYEKAKRGG